MKVTCLGSRWSIWKSMLYWSVTKRDNEIKKIYFYCSLVTNHTQDLNLWSFHSKRERKVTFLNLGNSLNFFRSSIHNYACLNWKTPFIGSFHDCNFLLHPKTSIFRTGVLKMNLYENHAVFLYQTLSNKNPFFHNIQVKRIWSFFKDIFNTSWKNQQIHSR